MFQCLVYNVNAGVNALNTDLTAAADDDFSRRNNHYIFTEDYNLIGAYAAAPSLLRARTNIPTINAIGRHHIYPINVDADVPDDPMVQDLRDYPVALPVNEEIAIEISNNLGAATEQTYAVLFIAPRTWTRNIPRGQQMLTVRATGAIAGVAQAWSGIGSLVFDDNLRGGWYSIVGLQVFDAGVVAARLVFPRAPLINGRKLRPGVLGQQSLAERPWRAFDIGYGRFGDFHSFEPPQMQIYATATAASTQEVRMTLVYHGERIMG